MRIAKKERKREREREKETEHVCVCVLRVFKRECEGHNARGVDSWKLKDGDAR